MSNSMINPSIVELTDKSGDRYSLVVIASKRARLLIDGDEPLVKVTSKKPLTVAINEVNEGKIQFEAPQVEGLK
ncbi:DNA-directed RNA polymerase subunit omega [Clostridium cellulovorans]|uniref:DNA-directed RNA polymerase subunit omega n=1 Tax=Clostridium cellulovorans (strain ATCC 35296 / DSM 3052 / OCM 3 / 743B) TaxID=573061 RepID=D9SL98_CLOC7|nr:DNA-directed RNA polymerase subunit omega [Clostridium cellulovorans]ADL51614.1 DNA-directed RNA polymerase, omega subunit [Clostridium cellulovorans 743B]